MRYLKLISAVCVLFIFSIPSAFAESSPVRCQALSGGGKTLCEFTGNYTSGMMFTWNISPRRTIVYPYNNPGLPFTTTNGTIIFTHSGSSCPNGTRITLNTVRANGVRGSGSYYCGTPPGSIRNVARNATADASSTFPTYSPRKINDGSKLPFVGPENSWTNKSNQSGKKWVRLTFPKVIEFNKIFLLSSERYEVKEYKIQYRSSTSGSWKTAVHVKNNKQVGREHRFSRFLKAKQVRVLGIRGPSGYIRVNELEVYGR